MEQKPNLTPKRIRYLIMIAALIVGIGVVFYHSVEKLSYLDALYFSVITLTTVGYGDIVPKTDAGKMFTIVYVLVGIGILGVIVNILIKNAAAERIEKRQKKREGKE